MKILGWEEEYGTGIKQIDENNMIITALMNQLLKIFHEVSINPEFHRIYATILVYARKEFDMEENYMQKVRYDQYKLHKNQHREFINKMEGFAHNYLMGDSVAYEFGRFAQKWLEAHIKVSDKRYVPQLQRLFDAMSED